MNKVEISAPYLIFLGSETNPTYAKTGKGIADWQPEKCVGQFHLPGGTVDLGLAELSLEAAIEKGARTLVVGTATIGGGIPKDWITALKEALELGLDIAAGVHTKLSDQPELVEVAGRLGRTLTDVRVPPKSLPVGTGKKRTGKRLLTIGTDCALGKKYTALQLAKELGEMSVNSTFRATGQTGILIAGEGMPIDAVVADFVSGAAEVLSPDNQPDHWDIIEGQGSLHHPGYMAVSVGLLLGSQPDAFVVCTEAGRTHVSGWPDFPLPSIAEVIQRAIDIGRRTNPAIQCVGISVNTSSLGDVEAREYLAKLTKEHSLPATDPLRLGMAEIAAAVKAL
jgi:uncharacterized NAD-dependent epimerase/dehydratase family protein